VEQVSIPERAAVISLREITKETVRVYTGEVDDGELVMRLVF